MQRVPIQSLVVLKAGTRLPDNCGIMPFVALGAQVLARCGRHGRSDAVAGIGMVSAVDAY